MKTPYLALLLIFAFTITGFDLQAQSIDSSATRPDKAATSESDPAKAAERDTVKAAGDSTKTHRHSHFLAELTYQSNNVYLGRKDSEALHYIMPSFTYNHKSGMYFSASAAYLKNSTESRIDVFTLEGGYAFDAGIYSGDFTASKYFYNTQSTSVTSGITFSVTYRNELDLGFITPSLTTGLDFGANTDVNGSLGLEHEFDACDDKLKITPTFVVNGSTLNFYDNYFRTRRFKKRSGSKIVTGTVKTTGTVQDAGTFRVLDYETSLPLRFTAKKLTFSFTPTFAIPINPAVVDVHSVFSTGAVTNKTTVEKLSNTFFWTLGISWKF